MITFPTAQHPLLTSTHTNTHTQAITQTLHVGVSGTTSNQAYLHHHMLSPEPNLPHSFSPNLDIVFSLNSPEEQEKA